MERTRCPGSCELSDPLDLRQIFDENGNDVIRAFKKTFRDDHVHKGPRLRRAPARPRLGGYSM